MSKEPITVYQPDNTLKNGYFQTFREIYQEIIENKWLIYQLFKRDFSTIYKQSFIGILWVIIIPVINVGLFSMLGHSGIFNVGKISAPYPIYAILGISMWQLFSSGLIACGNALSSAGDMLIRIKFSKKSLVIASVGRSVVTFLVQILLIALLLIVYKFVPAQTVILFPLIILPILIFTLGIGLITAILNSIVRDTGNILSVILMLGMYATPVLYAKPTTGLLAQITAYNPMYYFICSGRDLALTGHLTEPNGFIISSVLALFIFIWGLIIFHLTETRITERV